MSLIVVNTSGCGLTVYLEKLDILFKTIRNLKFNVLWICERNVRDDLELPFFLKQYASRKDVYIKYKQNPLDCTEYRYILRKNKINDIYYIGNHVINIPEITNKYVIADCIHCNIDSSTSEYLPITTKKTIDQMTTFGEGAKIYFGFVDSNDFVIDFESIKNEVKWGKMIVFDRPVPRLVAMQCTMNNDGSFPLYRHPVDIQPIHNQWTSTISKIRDYIETKTGQKVNHSLIQYYRDGTDYIGEHSDKTLDIDPNSCIFNYTIGATRKFNLYRKSDRCKQTIPMRHNSLLCFDLKTNEAWTHEIKQDKRPKFELSDDELSYNGERISMTFRVISTFYNPRTNTIKGQGERKDGKLDVVDCKEMLDAFSEENRSSNFDKKKYENGFNAMYTGNFERAFLEDS
jgi:hypothetical protein